MPRPDDTLPNPALVREWMLKFDTDATVYARDEECRAMLRRVLEELATIREMLDATL